MYNFDKTKFNGSSKLKGGNLESRVRFNEVKIGLHIRPNSSDSESLWICLNIYMKYAFLHLKFHSESNFILVKFVRKINSKVFSHILKDFF